MLVIISTDALLDQPDHEEVFPGQEPCLGPCTSSLIESTQLCSSFS